MSYAEHVIVYRINWETSKPYAFDNEILLRTCTYVKLTEVLACIIDLHVSFTVVNMIMKIEISRR